MTRSKKRLLWLLLLIPLIYLSWHAGARWQSQSGDLTPKHFADSQPTPLSRPSDIQSSNKPAPFDATGREARLMQGGQGTECILTGRVTDKQGEALRGAVVSLHRWRPQAPKFEWPDPIISQACDDEGRFTIRLILPLHASIVVRQDGYAQRDEDIDFINPGTVVRNFRLRPAPACIEGYVFDKDGRPIPGAMVQSRPDQMFTSIDNSWISSTYKFTTPSGKYVFDKLPEGLMRIYATAPELLRQEHSVTTKAGDCSRVDFHLSEAHELSFLVTNRRGAVISNATAGAQSSYPPISERGLITFAVPPDSPPFDCFVAVEGYKSKNFLKLDPKSPPSVVVLDDADVQRGRVTTESGEGVAGATVSYGVGGLGHSGAETDAEGRFSFYLSYSPVEEIRVFKPGYEEQRLTFSRSNPAPTDLELRIKHKEGGTVSGRVIDAAGRAAMRFSVSLANTSAAPGNQGASGQFDNDDGSFSLTGVPPGVYSLTVRTLRDFPEDPLPAEQVTLDRMEIKKGSNLGPLLLRFPPADHKK